jgi:hypothetical protein
MKRISIPILLYFVVTISIVISFSFLGNVNPYSFPSAVQASKIVACGKIAADFQNEVTYWERTLTSEVEYPIPSVLLAVLDLVANVPSLLLPFLPITGFTLSIYYLVILKAIQEDAMISNEKESILMLLSLTIIAFDLFARNDAHYVGRATLGVVFLVLASYVLLMFVSRRNSRRELLLLFILTIVISYTYYTAFLAILTTIVIYGMLLCIPIFKIFEFNPDKKNGILTLIIVALFLILIRPFISLMRDTTLSFEKFLSNIMDWVLTRLRIEQGEAREFFGEVPVDLYTRISTIWLGYAIRLLFIFTFTYYFLNEVLRRRVASKAQVQTLKSADIYAIITIGSTIAELFYTFIVPIISFRLITIFSVFYVPLIIIKIRNSKIRTALATFVLMSLILFYAGTFRSVYMYGKVNTDKYVLGLSSYISSHGEPLSRIIVTGDSYYTGYLWFMYNHHNNLDTTPCYVHRGILFTILDRDIYDLFSSHSIDKTISCIKKLVAGNTNTNLIVVNDGKPMRGTVWGYTTIPLPSNINFLVNEMNMVYNDKNSFLLKLVLINFE